MPTEAKIWINTMYDFDQVLHCFQVQTLAKQLSTEQDGLRSQINQQGDMSKSWVCSDTYYSMPPDVTSFGTVAGLCMPLFTACPRHGQCHTGYFHVLVIYGVQDRFLTKSHSLTMLWQRAEWQSGLASVQEGTGTLRQDLDQVTSSMKSLSLIYRYLCAVCSQTSSALVGIMVLCHPGGEESRGKCCQDYGA